MANFGIAMQKETDQRGDSRRGQTNDDGECNKDENENDGARHDDYRSGLKAQASISTAPPNGNDATPIVLRAGRLPSKPAT